MPEACPNGRTGCKGHKHYRGGIMDGAVSCLTKATPSDFPERMSTIKLNGQRSCYERDHTATTGTDTEAFYKFVGTSE